MARDPNPIYPPRPLDTSTAILQEERRASLRRPTGPSTFVRYRQGEDSLFQLAVIWDISAQGIGLFVAGALEPGAVLHLRFPHRTAADRSATVVHATAKEEGWLVGCHFERPLEDKEMEALLA
jgi:hypothetical protein